MINEDSNSIYSINNIQNKNKKLIKVNELLLNSVLMNNLYNVKYLLERGGDPNLRDEEGNPIPISTRVKKRYQERYAKYGKGLLSIEEREQENKNG